MAGIDSKLYEAAGLKHEAIAGELEAALSIVARYVRDRKRVLTGGMAIDFALRARGSRLYPDEMLAFPDYDFVTPDSVGDSQTLADMLQEEGLPNVSAIGALHVQTRRVRVDNRPVADSTYVPPDVYERIPYIEYDGFRVVAPTYQRMDQHLALSRPFLNTPTESVFGRYKKDVDRFNLLDEFYPIELDPDSTTDSVLKGVRCRTTPRVYPRLGEHPTYAHGHLAYAVLYETTLEELGVEPAGLEGVIPMRLSVVDGQLEYDAVVPELQLLVDRAGDGEMPKGARAHNPLLDLIPESWRFDIVAETPQRPLMRAEVWRFDGTLIPVGRAIHDLTVPSVQYVLLFMLTKYFFGTHAREAHLVLYVSLLRLLGHVERHYAEKYPIEEHPEKYERSPFFLPLATIGATNMSEAQLVSLMRLKSMMGEKEALIDCLPPNYWPPRSRRVEDYDYEACVFFMHDGKEVRRVHGGHEDRDNRDLTAGADKIREIDEKFALTRPS